MTSSFQSLNSKYNTLLALELNAAGGAVVVPTLQEVTDAGNIIDNSIQFTNGAFTSNIGADGLLQISAPDYANELDIDGLSLTTTTLLVGSNNAVLDSSSLTFTETTTSIPPLPDIVIINSLTQGELRLEDVTNVLQIQASDILINNVGGQNGQVLTYDSGLIWAYSQFQSGTITFDPLDPGTGGTVTFSNPYVQVIAPKVFLTFNNNNTIVFINFAVKKINPHPVIPAFIGFDWEISTESSNLIDMSLSWFSLA